MHSTTTQTLDLLHSLQVVLLINIDAHHCATPGSIVQRQLTTNAMSSARYLEWGSYLSIFKYLLHMQFDFRCYRFPTYQHYLAADVLLLFWQHSLRQCDQQFKLNTREEHQKLQKILQNGKNALRGGCGTRN